MDNAFLLKYWKVIASFTMLALLMSLAWDAPISGDEYVHHEQGRFVQSYFTTFGTDSHALETPVTNLKYYGQSVDNVAAFISALMPTANPFRVRHLLNAFLAGVLLMYAFKMGHLLKDSFTGVLTVLFLLVSPRFLGHSLNNLKDLPFALGYLASLYYTLVWLKQLPSPSKGLSTRLAVAIAFTISVRAAGLLMICYLSLFSLLWMFWHKLDRQTVIKVLKNTALVAVVAYFAGLLLWPYGLENPFWHPVESLLKMSNYPVVMRQLFEGRVYWSDLLPRYYLLKMVLITMPLGIAYLFVFNPLMLGFRSGKQQLPALAVLYFAILFPVVFILIKHSNVYGGMRHVLFIYPLIALLAAHTLSSLLSLKVRLLGKIFIVLIVLYSFVHPLRFSLTNHPYHALYFNPLVKGLNGAQGRFEMDYYYLGLKDLTYYLQGYSVSEDTLIVASNFRLDGYDWPLNPVVKHVYTPYYKRYQLEWDVGLFIGAHLYPFSKKDGWCSGDQLHAVVVDGVTTGVLERRVTKTDASAWNALRIGNYIEADSLASLAISELPNNHTAWWIKGKCFQHSGDYLEAIDAFTTCLTLVSNYEPALLELGRTAQLMGHKTKAMDEWRRLLRHNPRHEETVFLMVDALKEEGQLLEAKQLLEETTRLLPGNQRIKNELILYNQSFKTN